MLLAVLLLSFEGPSYRVDLFGASVAALDDLDGGGKRDIAIGDPAWGSDRDRGRVWIVSMETGRAIQTLGPKQALRNFGWTIASVGDVDGDGKGDLAVGTMRWNWAGADKKPSVTVFSCMDGRVLHTIETFNEGFWYAWWSFCPGPVVAGLGDWNGDRCADFAIGSAQYSDVGSCAGRVDVVSGRDGRVLHRFLGDYEGFGLGVSLCAISDLDGEGRAELAAGAVSPWENACDKKAEIRTALVRVYSSRDGSVMRTIQPSTHSQVFGLSVAPAGDLDGDGKGDLWVGEPLANFIPPNQPPGMYAWSTRSWTEIARVVPWRKWDTFADRRFGSVLVPVARIDGDGGSGVVATNPGSGGGGFVVIGADTKVVRQRQVRTDAEASNVGLCAADVGDVDGDGAHDVALGGVTWRGELTGVAVVCSVTSGAVIREFTRASVTRADGK